MRKGGVVWLVLLCPCIPGDEGARGAVGPRDEGRLTARQVCLCHDGGSVWLHGEDRRGPPGGGEEVGGLCGRALGVAWGPVWLRYNGGLAPRLMGLPDCRSAVRLNEHHP